MKLQEIKAEVFKRVGVTTTSALKKQWPDLAQGRDLRYKSQWLEIQVLLAEDVTLADLAREEQEMKQSLHRIGRLVGTAVAETEEIWQNIQRNSQRDDLDVTLAELTL
jgi:hypothetical protein